jgi:aerobic-type carbon monoxide dehydrogenase small subunit (CoxS/CutS family)
MKQVINLIVNEQEYELLVPSNQTLLDLLRDQHTHLIMCDLGCPSGWDENSDH